MEQVASYAVATEMQDNIGDMGVQNPQITIMQQSEALRLLELEACARKLACVVKEPSSSERAAAEQAARRLGLWPREGK